MRDAVEEDVEHARRCMARDLNRTMTFLAARHCATHGWDSNHVFTKAEAELPMNKKFFLFSVFYTATIFRVDINFPAVKLLRDKSKFTWKFISAPAMNMKCTQSPPLGNRFAIFQALLFIEQHMRLLLHEIYPGVTK